MPCWPDASALSIRNRNYVAVYQELERAVERIKKAVWKLGIINSQIFLKDTGLHIQLYFILDSCGSSGMHPLQT